MVGVGLARHLAATQTWPHGCHACWRPKLAGCGSCPACSRDWPAGRGSPLRGVRPAGCQLGRPIAQHRSRRRPAARPCGPGRQSFLLRLPGRAAPPGCPPCCVMCVYMHACVVCMYVCNARVQCMHVCMYVCMHACMHVCTYACNVCMYAR